MVRKEKKKKRMERNGEILRFRWLPESCLVFSERGGLCSIGHKTFIALSGCSVSPGLFIK